MYPEINAGLIIPNSSLHILLQNVWHGSDTSESEDLVCNVCLNSQTLKTQETSPSANVLSIYLMTIICFSAESFHQESCILIWTRIHN